jgi:chitosanase
MRRRLVALLSAAATLAGIVGAAPAAAAVTSDLAAPDKKEIAMELVSSAENSSLNWRAQYRYIDDIGDGRGYTAGIIGLCSGTGDMLEVVRAYTAAKPKNRLAKFLPALRRVNGSDSHAGLGPRFVRAWRRAARDPAFRLAQDNERDRVYFDPSVELAKADGLNALGQFAYYDAAVVHGVNGLKSIRRRTLELAPTPAAGGDEVAYLDAFLDERVAEMRKEAAHRNVSRIETAQRRFLREGNLDLHLPLRWAVYGDKYEITALRTAPARRSA